MKDESIISVEMSKGDMLGMIAATNRLTAGLSQYFGNDANGLMFRDPNTGRCTEAEEWISYHYETVAGAVAMIHEVSEFFYQAFLDKTVTITD